MKRILFLSLYLMAAMLSFAHDFEVDGIYYRFTSSTKMTVGVTYGDTQYTGAVTIPSSVHYDGKTYSVTSIGSSAFGGCSSLTSVNIPNSVTTIGKWAFFTCTGLTSIEIPNNVATIGDYAFAECGNLNSITIPNSVMSIGAGAFGGCLSLTSIKIDEGNPKYDSRDNCNAIIETASNNLIQGCKNTIIPNSVTSIGVSAFYGCIGLTSIEIPISVTTIGGSAFYICNGLTSVTIPNSVTNIGAGAFGDCSSLTYIRVDERNPKYDSRDNCNAIIETASNTLIQGCQNTIIPNSVTTIGDYAFYGYRGLASIEIPNSVTSIGKSAFYDCSGLTSVTIPNSVTTVGDYAFSGCSGLTSVTIGNSVTSIGSSVFWNCSGLTSVTIPNSVTTIGSGAFYNCSGLTSVTIPNSVLSIDNAAFSNCSGLKKVIVPDLAAWCNISFGNYAANPLYYAKHIYSDENTEITDLVIPNSVTSIGKSAFYGCTRLISVTIPNSVTTIGESAFYGCTGLKKVIVPDLAAWCNISFEDSGANPLHCAKHMYSDENTEITKLVIPNSVTTIGEHAFRDCSGLASVTIGNSVTSIDDYAFVSCSGLTSVTIGNSVTSIGKSAFYGCRGLKEITSYIQEPFQTGDYCWDLVDKSIPLYVPAGTKEKYQSTDGWKEFTNIIEFGGGRIEPATESKEVDMAVVPDQMDLNGMVVGDTYYVLDAENGDGADSENGCVVINTTTTDEAVNGIAGKDISDASVKAAFKGIIFMVPAGTGIVSINAETLGTSSLKVKIGSQAAQAFQLAERETVEIPYSVAEPTYVYIYAGTGIQAARSVGAARAAAAENSVKVYSYKWEPTDPTGINSVDNSQSATGNEAGDWYTIDGRRLSGKPVQKGIYIVNGRKVAVK